MYRILWALTAAYLAGLAALLWVSRHHRAWYARAKALMSLGFVTGTVLAGRIGVVTIPATFAYLVAGLVLYAGGDVLLGVANKRTRQVKAKPFAAGAGLFLLAHLLLCVAFYQNVRFELTDLLLPLLTLASLWLLDIEGLVRLRRMRPLAYLYAFAMALMANTAIRIGMYLVNPMPKLLLAGGATLFYISDVLLLFLYFGRFRHKSLRYWNLISYYIGIYCLAMSAYWL